MAEHEEEEHYEELDDPQEEEDELQDDDEELEEEEEEEEDEDAAAMAARFGLTGLGGFGMPQAAARGPPAVSEWSGLKSFPAATQTSLLEMLSKLRAQNINEVTILLLGKSGAGKSSTANSLFGERVAQVNAFQADTTKPTLIGRTAAGFTMNIIDTPGLLDGDYVNQRALNSIAKFVHGKAVHAVLYVDRLDLWRVDKADKAVFEAISATLGKDIWERTLLALTHGQMPPPEGLPYGEFTVRRVQQLRSAMLECLKGGKVEPPLEGVLVENSGRCSTNDGGEKVLPNGAVWVSALMEKVTGLAKAGPAWMYDSKVITESDPNKKNRWIAIPLLLFQVFVLRPVMVSQMKKDGEPGEAD